MWKPVWDQSKISWSFKRWWLSCYVLHSIIIFCIYELRDDLKDTVSNGQGRERLQDYYSPSKISGLIFSRCCSTTWILCRASPPAVALLCAPTSPTLSEMWDQVRLWVRVCDDVIAMSLGGGGAPQRAKWMNHGSFWGKTSIDHRHALSPYDMLRILLSLTVSLTHTHTHTHTHTRTWVWVSRQRGSQRQCVSVYGLRQALCAVVCRECWQIPCMFSGFVCERHESKSNTYTDLSAVQIWDDARWTAILCEKWWSILMFTTQLWHKMLCCYILLLACFYEDTTWLRNIW